MSGRSGHTRETRETRDERGAQTYGAGAGWLASRFAHRECKCEREVRGVRRVPVNESVLLSKTSTILVPAGLHLNGRSDRVIFHSGRVYLGHQPYWH
ncbi:hypothetical protein NDU88_002776 [Pleurodeles waltl]|uniref:Uncharacterized protein n=1 Tax=Pleurodeles waltl TaxID=8319 RepID=A0AAV7M3H4_PLEWA|nr:hypothetical protein NDU88_002776 [Pleurodeles waltl]